MSTPVILAGLLRTGTYRTAAAEARNLGVSLTGRETLNQINDMIQQAKAAAEEVERRKKEREEEENRRSRGLA